MRSRLAKPELERFLEKIEIAPNGCWEWSGARTKGYGKFAAGRTVDKTRRIVLAHRFAYEAFKGPIPEGLEPDHLCRNHGCVNPDHLEVVTRLENVRRGEVRNSNRRRGEAISHCPKGHPYDKANTYIRKDGSRQCRACRRESNHKYYWTPGTRERLIDYQRQRRLAG